MKFARIIFNVAGIYGLIALLPQYFLEGRIGQSSPPAITHPEYFYGFAGVAIAWQIVFLIIASDPLRFRPLMLAALVEKFPFVISSVLLIAKGRTAMTFAVPVAIDFILGLLFLISFIKTGKQPAVKA